MMEVRTIYAVVKETRGSNAIICQIVALQTTTEQLIIDNDTIVDQVGNQDVFVPVSSSEEFGTGSLIEIKYKDVNKKPGENRLPTISYHFPNGIVKSKLRYAIEISDRNIKNQTIDLDRVVKAIDPKLFRFLNGYFYLSVGDEIFGPFKYLADRHGIVPDVGKHTSRFKLRDGEVTDYPIPGIKDLLIVLRNPTDKLEELDCSTDGQLVDWLKGKIKSFPDSRPIVEVLNKLRKQLSEEQFNGIDLIRYSRVRPLLDNLILNFEELETIKKDEAWNDIFNAAFEKYKHEYKDQIEVSFQEHLREQERHLNELNDAVALKEEKISGLLENIENLTLEKKSLNEEILHLTTNRQKIIQDLKLQLELTNTKQNHIQFCEVLEFSNPSDIYYNDTGDVDYMDDLEDIGVPKVDELNDGVETLRSKKFILGYDINFTLTLIRSIGNAKAYLQQAEGDWLKFEKWYSNGLAAIIDSATSHPKTMYFYVLQDYNIASPECYAKPIIDISRGIRKKVPGADNPWPRNLWIVFIPLEVDIDEFGFEINEETFKSWEKLPESKITRIYEFTLPKIWSLL